MVESIEPGSNLIVPELSRLGRSLIDVLELLNLLTDKGVKVHGVKKSKILNGSDPTDKMMRVLLAMFAEIERDLISMGTREALGSNKDGGRCRSRKAQRPGEVEVGSASRGDRQAAPGMGSEGQGCTSVPLPGPDPSQLVEEKGSIREEEGQIHFRIRVSGRSHGKTPGM